MITLQGIKLKDVTIGRKDGKTGLNVSGNYELVTQAGIVLATQPFNASYGDGVKVQPSGPLTVKIAEAVSQLKSELEMVLGLTETEETK